MPTLCNSDHIWSFIWNISVKKWFVRVSSKIFNTSIETQEIWQSKYHILGSKMIICVTNANPVYDRNNIYPANIMSKFSMILKFWFLKSIYFQWNWNYELLLMCGVCPKRCINVLKFSIRKPFFDQLHDVIILINSKNNRILYNQKIQVFKDRSLLNFRSQTFFERLRWVR